MLLKKLSQHPIIANYAHKYAHKFTVFIYIPMYKSYLFPGFLNVFNYVWSVTIFTHFYRFIKLKILNSNRTR